MSSKVAVNSRRSKNRNGIFDAALTQIIQKKMVKFVSWYVNKWGYSICVEELIDRVSRFDS